MNTKTITVISATGGPYRDLTIEPGTTAADIKDALNISRDQVLTKGRGTEPIADDENLFETLADGAKIYATTPVEWGGAFLDFLVWLLTKPLLKPEQPSTKLHPTPECSFTKPRPKPERVTVQRTYSPPGRQSVAVARNPRPYWEERGWRRNKNTFTGEFKIRAGRWKGRVTKSPGGRVTTYIADPPSALKRHPHWPCFRKRDDGWYFVHPIHEVRDVSAAILSIENTLAQAFGQN